MDASADWLIKRATNKAIAKAKDEPAVSIKELSLEDVDDFLLTNVFYQYTNAEQRWIKIRNIDNLWRIILNQMKKIEWIVLGLKAWLKSNKIFFETIMAVTLSIAGVFVSCTANRIERDQNEIVLAQKNIEKEAASPFIDLASEYDEEGYVTKVDIVNSGGLLDTIDVEVYPYINFDLIFGHRGFVKRVEFVPVEYRSNGRKIEPYRILSPHTKIGVLYSIWGSDAEEYIKTITEGDKSELYHIYHLNRDKKAQDEETGDQVAYIVDSMSFEYLIKIEYSDLIDGEMNTDYFRVITGVGYGNNFNTGVKAIDLENSENAKLRDVLEGDNIIEIPYDQDNLDLDNGLKTLQRLLINASVAGALEENTSETKTESVIP